MYINDIVNCSKSLQFTLFADDTYLSCSDTQKSRHGSQRLTTNLQVRPSWQDDVRSQCLVGLHHGCWQAVSWCINSLICRAVRVGLYPTDKPNLHQLVADMDDALFARIQANEQHVLQQLLPAPGLRVINVLRSRRHDYTLSTYWINSSVKKKHNC